MDDTLSPQKAAVAQAAIARGLVDEDQPIAGFIDLDGVRRSIASLRSSFRDHFAHAFAAKACCLGGVLRLVHEAGMGCEVASLGEMQQALVAGIPADRIVFDSPAKSRAEIAL